MFSKPCLFSFFLVPICFWTPNLARYSLPGDSHFALSLLGLAILPIVFPVFYFLRLRNNPSYRKLLLHISFASVLGIWFFGPWFLLAGWTLEGRGFHTTTPWDLFFHVILFPMFTFTMSFYDGTFLTLYVISFVLPAIALKTRDSDAA